MCLFAPLPPVGERQHPDEEDRHENHSQRRGADHAANHADTDGALTGCAGSAGDRQRQDAQDEGQRSHDDRAKAQFGGFQRGVHQRMALLMQVLGEFDDENGVLRRQADDGDQANLEIDVVGHAQRAHREHRADGADRYDQHH